MFHTTTDRVTGAVRWAHDHLSATRSRSQQGHAKALNHAESAERTHKKRVSTKALRRAMAVQTANRQKEAIAEWQARQESMRASKTAKTKSGMPMIVANGVASIKVPVFNRMGQLLGIAKQRLFDVVA